MEVECSLLVLITNLARLNPLYDKLSSSKHPVDGTQMTDGDKDTVHYLSGSSVIKVSTGIQVSPQIC